MSGKNGAGTLEELEKNARSAAGFTPPLAFGLGLITRGVSGKILEVYFTHLRYQSDTEVGSALAGLVGHKSGNKSYKFSNDQASKFAAALSSSKNGEHQKLAGLFEKLAETKVEQTAVFLAEDTLPTTIEEVYLKLSLISHLMVKPRELNVDNVFDILPNVAWTSDGPIEAELVSEEILKARLEGRRLEVFSVDKFPKLLDFVVPPEVRVADGARVRLGAYVGPGTTIMQGGLIKYNAGTEGPNMVEGRISVGVFVGGGSDLGGGSSLMSSVYRDRSNINIGKDCVIGANSGAGISLGDECSIEAGLYVTAGTKVELLDRSGQRIGTVKAKDLSGQSNLLFRRNSSTGQVEAMESEATVMLNKAMHVNR